MENKLQLASEEAQLIEAFALPPTDAQQILASFKEPALIIKALDAEYQELAKVKTIDEDLCAKAKELRLKYVKTRTSSKTIHDDIKATVLLRSKAIDGAYNIFKLQAVEREEPLAKIEKHFELIEEERKAKLLAERSEMLTKLGVEGFGADTIKEMTPEIWESYYAGEKFKYDAMQEKIKNDAAIEAKRKADEAAENERIRKENVKLAEEKAATEAAAKKAQDEADAKVKLAEEKTAALELAEKARIKKEADDKAALEKQQEEDAVKSQNAKKNSNYVEWLAKNGVTKENIAAEDFIVDRRDAGEFVLYKRIDSIIIK